MIYPNDIEICNLLNKRTYEDRRITNLQKEIITLGCLCNVGIIYFHGAVHGYFPVRMILDIPYTLLLSYMNEKYSQFDENTFYNLDNQDDLSLYKTIRCVWFCPIHREKYHYGGIGINQNMVSFYGLRLMFKRMSGYCNVPILNLNLLYESANPNNFYILLSKIGLTYGYPGRILSKLLRDSKKISGIPRRAKLGFLRENKNYLV